ncbi:V-type ATP synthase subunit E [Methanocella conradii]|uniref:V-type ATP synthase subunit E n=1 Tax=Methanocella conradii TaxID=1175444 RepID=UPI00157DFE6B|nr:V-type ATP synthase subunit E family protein [Methanocella conradii]
MDYENLMKSMEASAEEKREELLRKARESAAKIEEEARLKADEIVKGHISRASRNLEVDRNRLLYEARSKARGESAAIMHEYFSRAFSLAEGRLAAIRQENGYEDFFRRAMAEAIDAIGEKEFVLHVDPRDEDLCRRIIGTIGIECPVQADISCAGGLNVSTPDGRTVVFNTIESRLKSARERHRLEVFSALFGD